MTMKRYDNMRRFVAIMAGVVLFASQVATQQEEPETFVLPDITTVVDGERLEVPDDAVPDFSGALPENPDATDALPKLPSVDIPSLSSDNSTEKGVSKENQKVFMEGAVGLGWPYLFLGDFSVYRLDAAPFSIRFVHNTLGGHGTYTPEAGFFDSQTKLLARKTFSTGMALWNISGAYVADDIGLQGNSALFDDINRRYLSGSGAVSVPFGTGFEADVQASGAWFSRYAGFADSLRNIPDEDSVAMSFVQGEPAAAISWRNDLLTVALDGSWRTTYFIDGGLSAANRGNLNVTASVEFQRLGINADVGVVFLPGGRGGDEVTLVVPFSLGLDGKIDVPFSMLPVMLALEGGVSSMPVDFIRLEEQNPFTEFTPDVLQTGREQSDWYVAFRGMLPIRNLLSVDVVADFRKTAFGNGVISSTLEEGRDSITGLFASRIIDRTQLSTAFGVTTNIASFLMTVTWNAQWLDIPAGEPPHAISAVVAYSRDSQWGVELSVLERLGSGEDIVPEFGLEAFYRPSKSVRFAVDLTDVVKLFSGKERVYAEPYARQSGAASVSVQFLY